MRSRGIIYFANANPIINIHATMFVWWFNYSLSEIVASDELLISQQRSKHVRILHCATSWILIEINKDLKWIANQTEPLILKSGF
jgi:hypothetical protein